MRRFRDIIESPFPVPTNCLWIKGTNLKGFINGNWVNLGGNDRKINWSDIEGIPEFAAVATTGSYNDLSNKPTIPSAYTLPNATATLRGGVLMAEAVADTTADGTETTTTVAATLNALLASLRTAGILNQ